MNLFMVFCVQYRVFWQLNTYRRFGRSCCCLSL